MSGTRFTLDPADREAVRLQLGRSPRGEVRVVVRCGCGLPAVLETYPLVDGKPFPTLFWLTCRRAIAAVGRLEAAGRMREINERVATDEVLADALAAAQADYIARRDALVPLGPDAGGVGGGPLTRVKCLHAHYAHHLVCGCNPVGAWVAEQIGDVLHAPPCAS